jgi:hypothetical protein
MPGKPGNVGPLLRVDEQVVNLLGGKLVLAAFLYGAGALSFGNGL